MARLSRSARRTPCFLIARREWARFLGGQLKISCSHVFAGLIGLVESLAGD
jgi:hypothetical protein